MSRTTLADRIQDVRGLTNASTAVYTIGTANMFDDDHVNQILDRHRVEIHREELTAYPTMIYTSAQAGGSLTWLEYRSQWQYFESTNGGTATFIVQDMAGSVQPTSAYTPDYVRGIVTFTANTQGSAYVVTGYAYDIYGAAAELLRSWAAHEALSFDFQTDGQQFRRSQKAQTLRQMADEYAMQAWPMTIELARTDVGDGESVPDWDDAKHHAHA